MQVPTLNGTQIARTCEILFSCHQNQTHALQCLRVTWKKPFLTQKKGIPILKLCFFVGHCSIINRCVNQVTTCKGIPRVFAKPLRHNSQPVNAMWFSLTKRLNTDDFKSKTMLNARTRHLKCLHKWAVLPPYPNNRSIIECDLKT
jgi:hypothetical protein